MKVLRFVALGVVGAVALAACGDSSPDADPQAAPATTDPSTDTAGAADDDDHAPAPTAPPTTAAPDLATELPGTRTCRRPSRASRSSTARRSC